MEKKRDERISRYSRKIRDAKQEERKKSLLQERHETVEASLIPTTFFNKVFLILSILIPMIGVIFQGIQLLK